MGTGTKTVRAKEFFQVSGHPNSNANHNRHDHDAAPGTKVHHGPTMGCTHCDPHIFRFGNPLFRFTKRAKDAQNVRTNWRFH